MLRSSLRCLPKQLLKSGHTCPGKEKHQPNSLGALGGASAAGRWRLVGFYDYGQMFWARHTPRRSRRAVNLVLSEQGGGTWTDLVR